jgi:hypothetical protein
MFTNPSKIKYTFANSINWAVSFDDNSLNLIEASDGTPLFPASDVSFKEFAMSQFAIPIGINGNLDMSVPSSVQRPTKIDLSFMDDSDHTINTKIRDWILSSPVFTVSRSLNIHKPSSYTKTVTLYKLKENGTQITKYGKQVFTVFPSEELVQLFNSSPSALVDKLTLRCY